MTGKISKYAIYASKVNGRWMWWARPPWHPPVCHKSWDLAARYLTMRHRLAMTERDEREAHRRHR